MDALSVGTDGTRLLGSSARAMTKSPPAAPAAMGAPAAPPPAEHAASASVTLVRAVAPHTLGCLTRGTSLCLGGHGRRGGRIEAGYGTRAVGELAAATKRVPEVGRFL